MTGNDTWILPTDISGRFTLPLSPWRRRREAACKLDPGRMQSGEPPVLFQRHAPEAIAPLSKPGSQGPSVGTFDLALESIFEEPGGIGKFLGERRVYEVGCAIRSIFSPDD